MGVIIASAISAGVIIASSISVMSHNQIHPKVGDQAVHRPVQSLSMVFRQSPEASSPARAPSTQQVAVGQAIPKAQPRAELTGFWNPAYSSPTEGIQYQLP
ncbi:hypothetical protein G7Z17_g5203 [Cylindrodendrum hubeiense]|uniref:Uncharacterized protein n=1 Tax=Cylindrodendrum hubeiense TaxID=595255 RepID=A0A9P5HBA7_9HYPO|nr:hypothetical protein G7Z17_g5203 [Cylindrodendrum hubeiense]